jgi:hypothetical protein
MTDDMLVSDAEWRAALLGAWALREVGERHRRQGAFKLARESDESADVLTELARRAVVRAEAEQAYAMYEALTDPIAEAERLDEAAVTGVLEPSDDVLRAEFDAVCAEVEVEAER